MDCDGETMTGAEALVRALEKLGVDCVFGYPGGAALPVFDAVYDAKFRFVLVRHEQGATHMADGYARATGKPAAVLVTSGPGATNTLTGIYTAFMDSVPMIVLCGQVGRAAYGKDSFQEVNIFGMSMPIVKFSYRVTDAHDVPRIVEEAWNIARSGRPGPVLLDLPKDVMAAACVFPRVFPTAPTDGARDRQVAQVRQAEISQLASYLRRAKRPLLLAGHGAVIANASDELLRLAERLGAPVTSTLLGKGVFPERHPLALGMLGMHGTAYANLALTRCDLILSIGSRWDDRINGDNKNFCKSAVKLHIDVDPAEIGKVVQADATAVGDAREILRLLNVELAGQPLAVGQTQEWLAELDGYKKNHPLSVAATEGVHAQDVLATLDRLTAGRMLVTTDVGQHQMWAAQFLQFDNAGQWITSGGAGTMGFGMPAALGCCLAGRDLPVVAVVGDGGFQMTSAELATAVRYRLPVKILVLDNKYLGMVRQWQDLFYENRLSASDLMENPDFVALAEAFGVRGFRISESSQIESVLKDALAYNDGPCLIHAEIVKEVGVYPMVPSGQSADKMILTPPDLNALTIRQPPAVMTPKTPSFVRDSNEMSFALRLKARASELLFMRLGFVLSKKVYSLWSYLQEPEPHGDLLSIRMGINGPPEEIHKLMKLLSKVVGVVEVCLDGKGHANEQKFSIAKGERNEAVL